MRIVVLGLGNSILADDAVGLEVADRVEAALAGAAPEIGAAVEVYRNESGGWDVLDYVEGADALVLVDASVDSTLGPGELRWYDHRELASFTSGRLRGVHNVDMFTALDYARRMGIHVPTVIHVLGIGVLDVLTLSEDCSPPVAAAIGRAADAVLDRVVAIAGGPMGTTDPEESPPARGAEREPRPRAAGR